MKINNFTKERKTFSIKMKTYGNVYALGYQMVGKVELRDTTAFQARFMSWGNDANCFSG